MSKVRKLIAALALTVTGVAVAPTGSASALSGCGAYQGTYVTRSWCYEINQSLHQWIRNYATCSATGSTRYYGPKIYTDGGTSTYNYSESGCGLGTGYATASGTTTGYG